MPDPLVLKSSPLVVFKRIILVEILTSIIAYASNFIIDYVELYNQLPFKEIISFNFLIYLTISLFQLIVIFFMFFSWYLENYTVTIGKIIHTRGNFYEKKYLVPKLKSITFKQTILGRLFRYGTVEIEVPNDLTKILIPNLNTPEQLITKIEKALGSTDNKAIKTLTLEEILNHGENQNTEFKSSLLWDYKQNNANKELVRVVVKSLASFMNSEGGTLVVGVDDGSNVLGLDKDLQCVKKNSTDGLELVITQAFNTHIGRSFRRFIEVSFEPCEGKIVCLIKVKPSNKPVYVKADNKEEFLVRSGNAIQSLTISEATEYISERFKDKKETT